MSDIKQLLSQTIDSQEKWDEVGSFVNCPKLNYSEPYTRIAAGYGLSVKQPWWANREQLRTTEGVYTQTTVLERINTYFPGYFIHVSKEDRTKVAYTPDKVMGEKDKQLRISPGKLFTKLMPLFTDHAIASLVEEHFAELNVEVEFLTSYDDIYKAYEEGPGSCMSVAKNSLPKHPASVLYSNHPYIRLAVVKDSEGAIIARSVVRLDTREFIRCYGADRLLKKLTLDGFKPGSFVGIEFEPTPVERMPNSYYMPYLDANNRTGSLDFCTAALINNKIIILDRKQAAAVYSTGGTAVCCTNTSGYVKLINIESEKCRDFITGEWIDKTVDTATTLYYGGELHYTKLSIHDILDLACEWDSKLVQAKYVTTSLGNCITLYAFKEDCFTDSANSYYGPTYVDTPLARSYVGFVTTWDDPNTWVIKQRTVTSSDGRILLSERAAEILLLDDAGDYRESEYIPLAELDKSYIKVHSPKRGKMVCIKKGNKFKTTASGRKVVPGYHKVVYFEDLQVWDFESKVKNTIRILSKTYSFAGPVLDTYKPGGYRYAEEVRNQRLHLIAEPNGYGVLMDTLRATDTLSTAFPSTYSFGSIYALEMMGHTEDSVIAALRSDVERFPLPIHRELIDAYVQYRYQRAEAEATDYNG